MKSLSDEAKHNKTDDFEGHVVSELDRGEHGALRVTRKRYQGKSFTDLRVYFRSEHGLSPTKKGCSVRDRELDAVIEALQRIRAKVSGQPANGQNSTRSGAS